MQLISARFLHGIRGVLRTACWAALAAGLGLATAARAEFPDRPIKLIVGFGAGTGSDIQGRAFAEAMARELKVPVVVENRAGAAGMLSASYVATAPADGYTILFGTTTSMVTLPLLSRNVKYDTLKDFVPIGTMGKSPFVVMVQNKPGAPATLNELIASTKAGPVSYGSIGVGSFGHLASVRLLQHANAQATHIPYKSSPQELQDLVAGNLQFATDSAVAGLPLIRNGLLKALAVTSKTRIAALPNVPTVAEVLGNDFEHTVWTGLLAPAGTPAPVVQKLAAAMKASLETKEVQQRFSAMELQPFAIDSPAFAAYIRTELPAWKAFLQKADIKLEE